MDISVVVPLYNEEESLPELVAWIERVMFENRFSYEIVMIDDGSKDNSWQVVEQLQSKNENIRGIKFRRNYGKSAALFCGFEIAGKSKSAFCWSCQSGSSQRVAWKSLFDNGQ